MSIHGDRQATHSHEWKLINLSVPVNVATVAPPPSQSFVQNRDVDLRSGDELRKRAAITKKKKKKKPVSALPHRFFVCVAGFHLESGGSLLFLNFVFSDTD